MSLQTQFAEFLGGKLNELRNCVVTEYCSILRNLEREACQLRSENALLCTQLKLSDQSCPPTAVQEHSSGASLQAELQPLKESQESLPAPEDAMSEQQIRPSDVPLGNQLSEAPIDSGEGGLLGSLGSPRPPLLETLEEGEEDEDHKRLSVATAGSDVSERTRYESEKDFPLEVTALSWAPLSNGQEPLKLPLSVKTVHELPQVAAPLLCAKPLNGMPGAAPGQNGFVATTAVSPVSPMMSPSGDKAETSFDSGNSFPNLRNTLSSGTSKAASATPPPRHSTQSAQSAYSCYSNMAPMSHGRKGTRPSVASVMMHALKSSQRPGMSPASTISSMSSACSMQSGVGGAANNRLSVPIQPACSPMSKPVQAPYPPFHVSPRTSVHSNNVDGRSAAAANAAFTDVLEELEGGKTGSPLGMHRQGSFPVSHTMDEATCFNGNLHAPEYNGTSRVQMEDEKRSNCGELTMGEELSENNADFIFDVWPIWFQTKDFGLANRKANTGCTKNLEGWENMDDDDSEDDEDEEVEEERYCRSLLRLLAMVIVHPSSIGRIFWDCLGVLCISYEFVMLPLQFLSLPQGSFYLGAAWAMRLYWTCDFPLSFLTGYNRSDGRVEKRPTKVIKNYVCTWMPFDIVVLTFDWVEMALGDLDGLGAARAGKAFKALRLLRMLRLIRLVRLRRMPDFMRAVAYKLQGERFVIVFGIIRIMIFLIGINHIVACCWYGIGDSRGDVAPEALDAHSRENSSRGWVHEYNYDRSELGYRYVTSFHWSLTQFTGSADIYPQNVSERTFCVMSLLFGFLLSASVVSSITSSMTRLQIVTARQSTQVSMLKQYLFDNGISTKVALRVQRNAMYTLQQATKNTPESAIELLSLVSEPLRMDLHYEIHMPTLCQHPFFKCYNEVNSPAMKKVCHTCVSPLQLSRGDVLFSSGEIPPAPRTYFCINGKLQYLQEYGYRNGARNMYAGHWACEAVLWTAWVHIGMLRAKTECSLQLLSAGDFQAIATQFQTREFYPKAYAQAFVQRLNSMDKELLSDLATPDLDVESICDIVFPRVRQPEAEAARTRLGESVRSNQMSRMLKAGTMMMPSPRNSGSKKTTEISEAFSSVVGAGNSFTPIGTGNSAVPLSNTPSQVSTRVSPS